MTPARDGDAKVKRIVGVADMQIGKAGDTLVTHALGSCLGLAIHDPVAKVGGLLHAMLPESAINPEKAKANPAMFVDTGVPDLFRSVYALGGQKKRMVVKAAGCSQLLDPSDTFKIGQRNVTTLKKLLWRNSVIVKAADVGGTSSRTVHFDVATGQLLISSNGSKTEL